MVHGVCSFVLCFFQNLEKKKKEQYSESLGWDPPSRESGKKLFFDVFGSPLKNGSFFHVIFPFMNPFQPAICIIYFNFPFKTDYIIVFIVPLKLINTFVLKHDYFLLFSFVKLYIIYSFHSSFAND